MREADQKKGFDWECEKGYYQWYSDANPDISLLSVDDKDIKDGWWNGIPAPMLWQAVKWLRSLGLHILVDFDVDGKWLYKVFRIGGLCVHEGKSGFPTYESALLAGIEAALKLI